MSASPWHDNVDDEIKKDLRLFWFHVEAEYENNNFLTRSGENGLAEVEEVDSSETLACADDAHKADVYTYSHFFLVKVDPTEIKEDDYEDTPFDKRRKTSF